MGSSAASDGMWQESVPAEPQLQAAMAELVSATRRLQDLVTGARPAVVDAVAAAQAIRAVNVGLEPVQVPEPEQVAGKLYDVDGRGQCLIPVIHYEKSEPGFTVGRLTFTGVYLGGNGAVHGGALPLVFDEVLGLIAGNYGLGRTRTAYLHVNYRRITPIGRELRLEARVDRVDGRKLFTTANLYDGDGDHLLADAEGLFIVLKPGQP